ncbi:response regulator [Phototrophicus methaneseepsis]|uniref:histidine kinase n=1 Tax=Phototrophicus methaneseepsis TaxID=2710758 RepID=A0A7S8ECF9_9CHLR|nr:response regulator [Phototrophicus methaneseepsis]QPC84188.1 response regulator [Phototrophicus methaneseepsis]
MKTILVIEDIDITRELIVHTLRQDYHILEARDGIEGLEIARQHPPNLILCDIAMPDMDGYQVISELRKDDQTASIPFIFLTAFDEREAIRYGMALGADDYLTKPFSVEELRTAVRAGLQKKALHDKHLHQKMDELRNNITTALPHELRTVVMVLEGYLQVMMDGSNEENQSLLLTMNQYAERLHRMSDKFLWYTELQTGVIKPADHPLQDAHKIITEAAIKHATSLNRQDDLRLQLAPTALCIVPEQLSVIMRELVENACQYSEAGTPIHIVGEPNNAHYFLHIEDQGRGMTPEQIAEVGAFMQFERDTYEQQGTGLGLVITKRLLELNGGSLTIHSDYGQSTHVMCTLSQS